MREKVKKYIKIISITVFFLIVAGYGIWRAQDLIRGVSFTAEIYQEDNNTKKIIEDGSAVNESNIIVNGIAKQVKNLTINGRNVFLDENWKYNEKIVLLPGYNIITLAIEDKFGETEDKVYRIINNSK